MHDYPVPMRQTSPVPIDPAPGAHDGALGVRARPRATPDRVVLLPLDSSEVRRVATATGPTFEAWQGYWDSLATDERDPLTEPSWVAGHLAGQLAVTPPDAFVMFVLAGDTPQTILPMTHAGRGAIRHASGYPSRSWPLAREHIDAALAAAFRARVDEHRVRSLHLDRVEDANALRRSGRGTSSAVHFRSLIEFPDGYEALLSSMTANSRKGVRRLRRRIERSHEVEVVAITAGVEMEAGFRRFLNVDDRSWKRKDGSVLRADVAQREALRTSMRHSARDERAVAHFLRVDGADVAAQLSVLIDGQLNLVKTSYDEEWANFGVGKLLLAETIRDWCEPRDIKAVNMVTGLPGTCNGIRAASAHMPCGCFRPAPVACWHELWTSSPASSSKPWCDGSDWKTSRAMRCREVEMTRAERDLPGVNFARTAVTWHLIVTLTLALINLSPLMTSWTLRELLSLNQEGNVSVWFSSTTLLGLGLLAARLAFIDPGPDRRGWGLVAAFFALLSLDEAASLHELAGVVFSDRVGSVEALPGLYAWVIFVTPPALIAAGCMLRWLHRRVPAGTPARWMAPTAIGLWCLVPAAEFLDPMLGSPRALIVAEEALELIGMALMLGALLQLNGWGSLRSGSNPVPDRMLDRVAEPV